MDFDEKSEQVAEKMDKRLLVYKVMMAILYSDE
jgi:hypothetical protein